MIFNKANPRLSNNRLYPIRLLELFGLMIVGYLIIMPWWPNIIYRFNATDGTAGQELSITESKVAFVKQEIEKTEAFGKLRFAPHRLVIAKIGVDVPIVEGLDKRALNYGAWHLPDSAQPADLGNMVISGHRFKYLPPNNTTFYNLDKLAEGDKLAIIWDKDTYYYKVTERKIVTPEQIEIVAPTADRRLTIYTCHPLWSQRERLVVVAKPI